MLQDGQQIIPLGGGARRDRSSVYLHRGELSLILNVYGRMVASGQWKDYALDFGRDEATFSVFRRASEAPVYRIVKAPALASRQGAWRIVGQAGQVLKRGHDLRILLAYFERKSLTPVS